MTVTYCPCDRKHHVVYVITNKKNGKIYIGKHSTNDTDDSYFGSSAKLKEEYKKCGSDFEKTIVKEFTTEQAAFDFEKKLLGDNWKRDDYYNEKQGGGTACDGANHNRHDFTGWREHTLLYSSYHFNDTTKQKKLIFECVVCKHRVEKWQTEVVRIHSKSKRKRSKTYACPNGCS